MSVQIEKSWKKILADEFTKEYFLELSKKVRERYLSTTVYPPPKLVFNAFEHTPFSEVKVVILGQDPYHGAGQAMGLSFSVPDDVQIPPSLQNIYKEIANDIGVSHHQNDSPRENSLRTGNLEHWADQGVLLLNATLTVEANQAASHQGLGWEQFTDAVIQKISNEKEHVVFLLWGSYARSKASLIDQAKHLVLEAPHPSPLSAHRGFFGCKHFSQTNDYLKKHNLTPIDW